MIQGIPNQHIFDLSISSTAQPIAISPSLEQASMIQTEACSDVPRACRDYIVTVERMQKAPDCRPTTPTVVR
jgi:hypothetical protein